MLANKIATLWCPNIIIKESKKTAHYIYFLFSHHHIHIMSLIWSRNWKYNGSFFILLEIKFGHVKISGPKIGILMLQTACINPWYVHLLIIENRIIWECRSCCTLFLVWYKLHEFLAKVSGDRNSAWLPHFDDLSEGVHLTLPAHAYFSVQVKSGVCYIMGRWVGSSE